MQSILWKSSLIVSNICKHQALESDGILEYMLCWITYSYFLYSDAAYVRIHVVDVIHLSRIICLITIQASYVIKNTKVANFSTFGYHCIRHKGWNISYQIRFSMTCKKL